MEPIPETAVALEEISHRGHPHLGQVLDNLAAQILGIVPGCTAISVGLLRHRVTFTLVASDAMAAALDAVPHLDRDSGTDAAPGSTPHNRGRGDRLDAERWALFARPATILGVASTLSFPIVGTTDEGVLAVGTLDMYAGTADAFDAHHDALAGICGTYSWAAVVNQDLAFSTRLEAAEAPRRIRDQYLSDQAHDGLTTRRRGGRTPATEGPDPDAARADVSDTAAARAGSVIPQQ